MKVGVVGAGTMGHGIAQLFAQYGHEVVLFNRTQETIDKARLSMEKSITRLYEKQNKTTREALSVIDSISFTLNLESLSNCELVIEAITEDIKLKKDLFSKLDTICSKETIMATNTSGLSITEIASATRRPDKVIGTHFFNPVPLMKLVEIVRGEETSRQTINRIIETCNSIEKEIVLTNEAPLFIVNRLLIPMINEAIFIYQDGLATKEDIDKAMKFGANHPIGPLALADLIGLDTLLLISETLLEETGDSKYRIPQLLKKKVRAKHLGRKEGKGFYEYKI